jgi:hypothetical protein
MARPDDLAWSDVGPWPSVDGGPAAACAGCGQRGTRDLIARDGLCWSCWARAWARATAAALDRLHHAQPTADDIGGATKKEPMNSEIETSNDRERTPAALPRPAPLRRARRRRR